MFNKNQHHSVGEYNFYEPHAEMHRVLYIKTFRMKMKKVITSFIYI
ncbi:hypothetical protein [Brachyspira catarrhinii]|nr:hypothetical protein [Brachyspira catarrhinii]